MGIYKSKCSSSFFFFFVFFIWFFSVEEATIQASNAGCDILLLGGKQLSQKGSLELTLEDIRRIHSSIVQAVKSGRISEQRIDESIKRILELKKRYVSVFQN